MRAVYIHIPFCNSICSYCDFCKFIYKKEWAKEYLLCLSSEIDEYYEGDKVKSIYIGGGTPSALSKSDLEMLFELVKRFKLDKDAEITFECNINDITEELLYILKDNDVNRLSIGVESFNKDNLKLLNRKHEKKDIFDKIKLAKSMGFNNINVDLIYALPIENMWILRRDIANILKLNIEHISTYSLIIEDHTMLYNKKIKPISEEEDYKMYRYICKKLSKKGYVHYEVSNFAKKGYESKHNLTYWNNEEYYGFGLGAHGFVNSMRYENTRNFDKYRNLNFRLNELLTSSQEDMENELILGLRKLEGISIKKFKTKFDKDVFKVFKLDEAIDKGYLVNEGDKIYIPENKIYVMNEIINMIM